MKTILRICIVLIIVLLFKITASAEGFFEYYFIPDTEPESEESTSGFEDYLDMIPEEIRDELPDELSTDDPFSFAENAGNLISFSGVLDKIFDSIKELLLPSLKSVTSILGIILVGAVLRILKDNLGASSVNDTADLVINMGIGITLVESQLGVISQITSFRDIVCNLMNGMIPLMSGIYITSGNAGTAAVQSGGIMMLVTLSQNIFANVLLPAIRINLGLGLVSAVFPDSGAKSVTTAHKNITIAFIAGTMTLFSFILSLQSSIAQSADTFSTKSIKFAIGNIVPIIGGAVSDSLGTIGGSLSLLKSAGGNVAIVAIILILIPTILSLTANRLVLYISKSVAGILGCKSEEEVLGHISSVSSVMIAFAVCISIAFIYALTLFTRSTLAIHA